MKKRSSSPNSDDSCAVTVFVAKRRTRQNRCRRNLVMNVFFGLSLLLFQPACAVFAVFQGDAVFGEFVTDEVADVPFFLFSSILADVDDGLHQAFHETVAVSAAVAV